jgi:hypothetical protein
MRIHKIGSWPIQFQTSQNALLEKRLRKFEAEVGLLQDECKAEAAAKDKFQKELDVLKASKFKLDEQIQVSQKIIGPVSHNKMWQPGNKISALSMKFHVVSCPGL